MVKLACFIDVTLTIFAYTRFSYNSLDHPPLSDLPTTVQNPQPSLFLITFAWDLHISVARLHLLRNFRVATQFFQKIRRTKRSKSNRQDRWNHPDSSIFDIIIYLYIHEFTRYLLIASSFLFINVIDSNVLRARILLCYNAGFKRINYEIYHYTYLCKYRPECM